MEFTLRASSVVASQRPVREASCRKVGHQAKAGSQAAGRSQMYTVRSQPEKTTSTSPSPSTSPTDQFVSLVNGDRSRAWHAQECRPHLQKPRPNGFTNADNSIDSWVQIAHPGHGIQKTEIADDATIGDDLYGQVFARPQGVGERLAVE